MSDQTFFPDEPQEALDLLKEAESCDGRDRSAKLRASVRKFPSFIEGWAALSEDAYVAEDDIGAYAFARAGYHRGLDRMRQSGWRGSGELPFEHEPNRGMLRALAALMRAAAAIEEGVEARRCREFLLQLDPTDHHGVAQIRPADLSRRVED